MPCSGDRYLSMLSGITPCNLYITSSTLTGLHYRHSRSGAAGADVSQVVAGVHLSAIGVEQGVYGALRYQERVLRAAVSLHFSTTVLVCQCHSCRQLADAESPEYISAGPPQTCGLMVSKVTLPFSRKYAVTLPLTPITSSEPLGCRANGTQTQVSHLPGSRHTPMPILQPCR